MKIKDVPELGLGEKMSIDEILKCSGGKLGDLHCWTTLIIFI